MTSINDLKTKLKTLTSKWFYLKSETDTLLNGKSDSNHIHNNYLTTHQDISGKVNTSDLVGTFTELQELITNASSGDTIVLEKNYKNTDNTNISINKSLTIIGNGHIIDGDEQSKYFMITGSSSVSCNIENVIFTNFTQGNAIQGYPQSNLNVNGHTLNVQYCTFINNKSGIGYVGNAPNKNISNCVFINHSNYAITIQTSLTTINCTFINSPINSNYVSNKNYLTDHQSITGKEDTSNKVTSWSNTTTDTNYPSEKLVKDSLNGKASSGHNHEIINGGMLGINLVRDNDGEYVYGFGEKLIYDVIDTDKLYYDENGYGTVSGNEIATLSKIPNVSGKEDASNKSSSILTDTGSTTKYPTVKAVEDYAQPKGNYLTEHQTLPTIADNLTTNDATKVLSAKQGKVLKDLIGDAISYINQGGNS